MNNTLHDAISNYWETHQHCKGANSKLNTALIKYTLPSLGLQLEKDKARLSKDDKNKALKFAETIQLTQNLLDKLLSLQEKTISNYDISKTNKRQQKKVLKEFIEYIKQEFALNASKGEVKTYSKIIKPIPFKNRLEDRSHIQKELSKQTRINKKIILSFKPEDYEGDYKAIKKELYRIELEIDKLVDYLNKHKAGTKKRRKTTLKGCADNLKRLLGWQYFNSVSLSEISIHNLIETIALNPNPEDYKTINDYYIDRGRKENIAKKSANKVIDFLEDFYLSYGIVTQRTKVLYAVSLLNLAKYLYRDITDINWCENYEDIPVIRRIRIFINSIEKDPQKIKVDQVSWELVIKVLEETRRKADMQYRQYLRHKKDRTNPNIEKHERSKRSQARDLQAFISMGLLTLVPPSRSRVIRELQLGKTFKHGLFKDGIFISKEDLDRPETAGYYIHLQPEDYKTGDTYGEWLGKFPNVKFKNGKTFYQYLDDFIYGWKRNYLIKQFDSNNSHNYLLTNVQSGKPINEMGFYSAISNRFKQVIGQSVSPHSLRTIFRTYLVNKNATEAELKSAAFWMRHSDKIAAKTYTKQSLDEKLDPGLMVATKLNSELLFNT